MQTSTGLYLPRMPKKTSCIVMPFVMDKMLTLAHKGPLVFDNYTLPPPQETEDGHFLYGETVINNKIHVNDLLGLCKSNYIDVMELVKSPHETAYFFNIPITYDEILATSEEIVGVDFHGTAYSCDISTGFCTCKNCRTGTNSLLMTPITKKAQKAGIVLIGRIWKEKYKPLHDASNREGELFEPKIVERENPKKEYEYIITNLEDIRKKLTSINL